MTVFWIVVALFLAGTLLFLLPPLLRPRSTGPQVAGANMAIHRHQLQEAEADMAAGLITAERLAQARREIERRVLEDVQGAAAAITAQPARRTALALALLLPLASVLIYLQLGRPGAVAPRVADVPAAQPAGARHSITPEQIQQRVAVLAERLKAQPADLEGWLMLARSYTALGRFRDAAEGFRRAQALSPKDPNILADLADVTGMAQNKRLAGEPARLVQQALDLDPRHVKALALAGSVAFEAGDYAAARGYWQRLLALIPPDSPLARSVQGSMADATQRELGATPAAAGRSIQGEVSLSPALARQVKPGDTLFIYARAEEGARMPLAIVRQLAQGGPWRFTLDDSQALSPQQKLSSATRVVVTARISHSGQATPQSGDLLGQSAPVAPGAQGLKLVIDRVQP